MIIENIVINKLCACCKQIKPIQSFWKRIRAKDGYASSCIDCIRIQNQKSYKNHWVKNRTRIDSNHYQFIEAFREKCNQIKHVSGCFFCKENDPICLDFHHKDSTNKQYTISKMINSHKNWICIQLEIDKCIVICANCHRKVHAGVLNVNTVDLTLIPT
jgi:hypothetical protein